MAREIVLNTGEFVVVDDDDYERLSRYRWSRMLSRCNPKIGGGHYATRKSGKETIFLHKEVLGVGRGTTVDHRDGNRFNDRKSNLRVVTQQQNLMNRCVSSRNRSGIKGVTWHGRRGRWVSKITVNGKSHWLGEFDNKVSAAIAYSIGSFWHHGEFGQASRIFAGEVPL